MLARTEKGPEQWLVCDYSSLKDTKMWCILHVQATVSNSVDPTMCVCVKA
jgi:hypothetical protein